MATDRERLMREAAARGKYAPLYRHLLSLRSMTEWRTGFGALERVLGFRLPDSARLHRPWWANSRKGSGHSHALAWQAAGWRTARVDLEAETLAFERDAAQPVATGSMRYGEGGDDMGRLTEGLREAPASIGLPTQRAARRRSHDWNLDRDFPARNLGPWPEGFTVSREQIYDDMGRLTGGPQDGDEDDR